MTQDPQPGMHRQDLRDHSPMAHAGVRMDGSGMDEGTGGADLADGDTPAFSAGVQGEGMLALCATPIGHLGDVSLRLLDTLRRADVIACEDTRRTARLLARYEIQKPLISYHEHNRARMGEQILRRVQQGQQVALVTDAGMPGISDPGADLVRLFIDEGMPFTVLPGPSALINALVLSGLPTERFVFEGFLPRENKLLDARLTELRTQTRTVILYEAPHRLAKTLAALSGALGERPCAVACELTKMFEQVFRGTLAQAARRYAAMGQIRGEFVLVIGGYQPPAPAEITDDIILQHLAHRIRQGASNKDAVAVVTRELGVPRSRVYALSLGKRER